MSSAAKSGKGGGPKKGGRPSTGKSAAGDDNKQFVIGDRVLGHIKGYPKWPGKIVDGDKVSAKVKKEKPGGKAVKHCVRFFPTADFAWLGARDMEYLTDEMVDAFLSDPHKKTGDLAKGYEIARDPTQWENDLETSQAAEAEELARLEAEAEDDQLEEGTEDGGAGKKRKRAPAKKGADAGPSKKAKKEEGSKKKGKESEKKDSKGADGEDPQLTRVKEWRHRLQRIFLGKDTPSKGQIEEANKIFKDIEEAPVTAEWLKASKLAKVLKHIRRDSTKDDLPGHAEIQERSQKLINKWAEAFQNEDADEGNGDLTRIAE